MGLRLDHAVVPYTTSPDVTEPPSQTPGPRRWPRRATGARAQGAFASAPHQG